MNGSSPATDTTHATCHLIWPLVEVARGWTVLERLLLHLCSVLETLRKARGMDDEIDTLQCRGINKTPIAGRGFSRIGTHLRMHSR